MSKVLTALFATLVVLDAGCGGGGSAPPSYTLSGTVSGLGAGKSVTLVNGGGNATVISANGPFSFPSKVPEGSTYAVSVLTHPAGQSCFVIHGSGTVRADVAGVVVACQARGAFVRTAQLATARYGATTTLLQDGRVLVAGGRGPGGTELASAEIFDPAGDEGRGTFTATGSLRAARVYATATLLASGKVLVAGGWTDGAARATATAELFDPAGNGGVGAFGATGDMLVARGDHFAALLPGGKVLVGGGYDAGSWPVEAELFDPAASAGAGAFRATASLPTGRSAATATTLPGGKVLLAGAYVDPSAQASALLFDAAAGGGLGQFQATGSLGAPRAAAGAALLLDGRVLVVGGYGASTVPLQAELFSSAAGGGLGAFTPTASLSTERIDGVAVTLADGRVLVLGGEDGSGTVIRASAELFDPAGNAGAGVFTGTGAMSDARHQGRAVRLQDGRVLVAGGMGTGGAALAGAELYGP